MVPAGLGYMATTPPAVLLRKKNTSPIGIRKDAHSSSESSNPSSQAVREPAGRYGPSPAKSARQVSHVQTIRRSSTWSMWRWSAGIDTEHRSQRSSGAAGGSSGRRSTMFRLARRRSSRIAPPSITRPRP